MRSASPATLRRIRLTRRSARRSGICTVASTTARFWRRLPQPEHPQQRMTFDALAEVALVLPLRLRHHQQALDHLFVSAARRVLRRVFVLHNVAALEFSGAVHRDEEAAD